MQNAHCGTARFPELVRFSRKPFPIIGCHAGAINYLNSRPSNNNYNAHRKDLSALFSWAKSQLKLQIHNPCADLDKMPHEHKRKRTPTEKEILSMIAAATPGDQLDIFMTCLHSLGRIDEVLRLTWEDINFNKRTVTLWTRKRKSGEYESDILPMNKDLYNILKNRWKKENRTSGYIIMKKNKIVSFIVPK